MSISTAATPSAARSEERVEVRRHLRRNYAVHSVEGGLFIGGMAFAHPQTVLPRMIERLHGPDWIIAASPILLMVGFFLPSLFITHRLERMGRLMRFVLLLGTVQRLPYLLVGLALVYATLPPMAVLGLVVLAPLSSGFFGGLSAPAWRELLAKSIPAERRASLWAIRFVIGGLLGVLAGQAVSGVLSGLPLTQAYGVLHLLVFALMLASLAVFALAREPNLTSARAHSTLGWWHHALAMRRVVAVDHRLQVYLGARYLYSGLFVALPFLSLHSLSVLGTPDGYLGRLLTFQMIGSVVGNLLGGFLGDRRGGRRVVILSLSVAIAVMASAGGCSTATSFDALYVALGLSVGLGGVGAPTLDLEMSPFERRMSYQTVIGLTHLAGMLSAVLIASLMRQLSASFAALSSVATALLVGSLGLLLRLREPRGDPAGEIAASG